MRVSDIRLERTDKVVELSGLVGDFRIWFRFPAEYQVAIRGDAFLAAAVAPAMLLGETLEIDANAPVSPQLLEGAERAQEIIHCWNPAFRKVPIRASVARAERLLDGAASFFSGGVDAAHTFLKHAAEITHLIFIRGFDLSFDNQALFERARRNNEEFALNQGKKLIFVETNAKKACGLFSISFDAYHGCLLGAIALALAPSRIYVAASHTYGELQPWGSHPILDPLWSTEATRLLHDGADVRRSEKLQEIAHCDRVARILRVCFEDSDYNCGVCSKCVRTRMTLRLLGLSVPTLAALESLEPVRGLEVSDWSDLTYFEDNRRLAEEKGDRDLAALLGRRILSYKTRAYLRGIDEVLLGGRMRRWRRWWKGGGDQLPRHQRIRFEPQ